MRLTIAFDVYGTLVDPVDMGEHLRAFIGDQAQAFGQLWHEKKVEYSFRRGLMDLYQDFGVCTLQALHYCMKVFQVELSERNQQLLMEEFGDLKAFVDVLPGLLALKAQGHRLIAFSNGPEAAVRTLMDRSEVLPQLDEVVSVDDVKTFKPSPRVYQHMMERTGSNTGNCWMVSSNPWDVIGAKAAGLKAAWIQRDPAAIFDPWGLEPDVVVNDLVELSEQRL